MASSEYLLDMRARAREQGDLGQVRAINADLARIGYSEPTRIETATGMETTAVRAPERAIPHVKKNRGGRPPLPRCEHGQIQGRCTKCKRAA